MPIPRRARQSALFASAAVLSLLLVASAGSTAASAATAIPLAEPAPAAGSPAGEPARDSSAEAGEAARLQAREQRLQAREERRQARERERAARARERAAGHCRLTLQASAQRITAGEAVNVLGKLLCPEATSAGERLVTVFRAGGGAGRSVIGTAMTEADGSYQLAIPALETNAMVSVRSPGARGARVAIKVAPQVVLSAPAAGAELTAAGGAGHRGAGVRATFTGTVGAAYAGAAVTLQSSYLPGGEEWRAIAFGRVDDQGSYSIAHALRRAGQTWIRVVVHPGRNNVPAASEAVSYEVVAAQNPKLTIQSSSPLISFGASVTISGVAAEAGGAQVELLASTAGGAFQPLASTTTDAAGRYTFTQAPQQRTAYQVRDASARSTTLLQGVGCRLEPEAAPASAVAGQPVSFTGTLAPAAATQRVELERRYSSGIGFHALAAGVLQGSSYSIAHTFETDGNYVLRIKVPGNATCEAASSGPFSLQVTPASAATLSAQEPAPGLGGEEAEGS